MLLGAWPTDGSSSSEGATTTTDTEERIWLAAGWPRRAPAAAAAGSSCCLLHQRPEETTTTTTASRRHSRRRLPSPPSEARGFGPEGERVHHRNTRGPLPLHGRARGQAPPAAAAAERLQGHPLLAPVAAAAAARAKVVRAGVLPADHEADLADTRTRIWCPSGRARREIERERKRKRGEKSGGEVGRRAVQQRRIPSTARTNTTICHDTGALAPPADLRSTAPGPGRRTELTKPCQSQRTQQTDRQTADARASGGDRTEQSGPSRA